MLLTHYYLKTSYKNVLHVKFTNSILYPLRRLRWGGGEEGWCVELHVFPFSVRFLRSHKMGLGFLCIWSSFSTRLSVGIKYLCLLSPVGMTFSINDEAVCMGPPNSRLYFVSSFFYYIFIYLFIFFFFQTIYPSLVEAVCEGIAISWVEAFSVKLSVWVLWVGWPGTWHLLWLWWLS